MENNIFHTVAVGSDHAGFTLKSTLITWLAEHGYETLDCGCYTADSVDYPDIAKETCKAVTDKRADCAVLICGTGIGVSIAANKVKGAYAALVNNVYQAQRAELSNHANIITMGAQVIGIELAKCLVKEYLGQTFDPNSRSAPKLKKIYEYENEVFG